MSKTTDYSLDERTAQYNARRDAWNAEAAETVRLMEVGRAVIPGVRIQDQREAGILAEMLQRGEITTAVWDAFVDDLRRSNKINH